MSSNESLLTSSEVVLKPRKIFVNNEELFQEFLIDIKKKVEYELSTETKCSETVHPKG
jgi:hypothetical protein